MQLRNIWARFVNPPVQHPVVNTFVLHSETTFWCLESGQRIMVPEDLLFLDLGCGTHCLCLFVNYMINRNNLKRHSKHFLCSSSERFCGFISEVALYQIFYYDYDYDNRLPPWLGLYTHTSHSILRNKLARNSLKCSSKWQGAYRIITNLQMWSLNAFATASTYMRQYFYCL